MTKPITLSVSVLTAIFIGALFAVPEMAESLKASMSSMLEIAVVPFTLIFMFGMPFYGAFVFAAITSIFSNKTVAIVAGAVIGGFLGFLSSRLAGINMVNGQVWTSDMITLALAWGCLGLIALCSCRFRAR